jgi:hypothetical protein
MTPIELLEAELQKWEHALEKLEEFLLRDKIPISIYNERKNNILPRISKYKQAIAILISYEV